MRIFLAGATGVIGSRLLPMLLERGDEVAALTRTATKAEGLEALGADPVVCDVYDAQALADHVVDFGTDLVIHQLTDLPDDLSELQSGGAANARMRREGTKNLLRAAGLAGADRFVAQSVAWEPAGDGGLAKQELESEVLAANGVVIRYGQLYGPGTYYPGDDLPPHPRIQVDVAVRRTMEFLDAPSGIVTIVDAA